MAGNGGPLNIEEETQRLEALRLQLEQREARVAVDRTRLDNQRRALDDERRRWENEDESVHGNYDGEDAEEPARSLMEIAAPKAKDVAGPVIIPGIDANNMQIAPAHVTLVQQNPFYGNENEDPHAHLQTFIDCTRLIKFNGVPQQAIRLLLFRFTLKDRAQKWYKTLKKGSIRSWDAMAQTFLDRYFSSDRADSIRREINNFQQREDESMKDAWERFRDLENSCPHHGIQDWMVIKDFYNGLYDNIKINLDSLSGGAFKRLDATRARDLIDECARSYTWLPLVNNRCPVGKQQVHEITTRDTRIAELEAELAAYRSAQGTHLNSNNCGACGEEGHTSIDCPLAKTGNGGHQINSINNEPSYFPRHIFSRSYSLSDGEQADWENMNHPKYHNNVTNRPYVPRNQYKNTNQPTLYKNAQFNNNSRDQSFPKKSVYNRDGIPPVVQDFMHEQDKFNQMLIEGMEELKANSGTLIRLEQMMESQFSRQQGKLPSQPEVNPNAQCKALHTLRSGTQYKDPPMPSGAETRATDMGKGASEQEELVMEQVIPLPPLPDAAGATGAQTDAQATQKPQPVSEFRSEILKFRSEILKFRSEISSPEGEKVIPEKNKGDKSVPETPYQPPVPFPRRMTKEKEDKQFRRFWEMLREVHITIPFSDVFTKVPIYARFLKELCTGKISLEELKTVVLTNRSSKALQSRMPPKLKDPGRFALPCVIRNTFIKQALCDMGASVSLMPKTVFERIGFGELEPTDMIIQLADSSKRLPMGEIKDVPVQVGKFLVPGDFVVMDMEEEREEAIGVDETMEELEYDQNNSGTHRTDEISDRNSIISDRNSSLEEVRVADTENFDPNSLISARNLSPQVELKPLPATLRYEFLGSDQNFPVIVNSGLDADQTEKLLVVLRAHKGAIGYSIDDLKGIDPSICTHRILLEEGHKPSIEGQRRLNPNLKEVVKKEILKLLDAGIIYPISDSKW
ncbi:hypothetical protein LUZ63_005664 [Rhynchospora breviuscula]|uniref:CCHC-type domain-containing protein n=1 Tax=Rhynchospora breviuscula TaxID=2022672 RepID=A0A9Q0HSS0_9POAL|nr:hypothetical protein LUZ63_005664 [Rhynchospora breviuscula]